MFKFSLLLLLLATTANAAYVQTPFPAAKGGSGVASPTAHGVLLGEGASPFSPLAIANNQILVGVTGADPVSALLVDANVSATAAIAYSKLNLALSIVNADINASAAIDFSKLAALTSAHILVGNGSNVATDVALSGDATLANTGALTLASTAVTPGSYTLASITVDAKGRITAASNGSIAATTVVDGGNTAYTILTGDDHVRNTTTLTANRAYTLPACTAGNIGEKHEVKNLPSQTFQIILTAAGSDNIDGSATIALNPGDSVPVICSAFAAAGTWDIE